MNQKAISPGRLQVAAVHTIGVLMRANLSMPAAAIIPVLDYPDFPPQCNGSRTLLLSRSGRIGAHPAQLQFEGGAIVVSEGGSPDAAPQRDIR